jgi:hypothetical protein
MRVRARVLLPLVGLGLGLTVSNLGAQSGASPYQVSLDRVEVLTSEGRIMAAREVLAAWLELMEPSASREDLQRAIWLRGRLTVDPSMAEADFRRLVLEYPGGPYSAEALWRLGLWAEARGDSSRARDFFASLARDYPTSSHLAPAAERGRPREGDATLPGTQGAFAVQLGAFQNLALARRLVERVRAAGHDPRLVRTPGDELARVRIGRFTSREGAEASARELRAQGFEVTVVSDATLETRISRGRS